jgi:hypothetical protein
MNLIHRRRFNYSGLKISFTISLDASALRNLKLKQLFEETRKIGTILIRVHYHFTEGEGKLNDELDVVNLLKTMRRVNY